jgi:S-formylglutathione hydrolase FrmB
VLIRASPALRRKFTRSALPDDAFPSPSLLSPATIALFRTFSRISTAMTLEQVSSNAAWEGFINKYKTKSAVLGDLEVQFNVFLPKESQKGKVPVLYYLAGLTCTEDTGYALARNYARNTRS